MSKKTYAIVFVCGAFLLFLLSTVLLVSDNADARVRGRCDNCHTMHNSQGGAGMVVLGGELETTAGSGDLNCVGCHGEPREQLLSLSCIGCHAMDLTGTGDPSVDLGGYPVPQVVYDTSSGLAAGNFYYMFTLDETGHNIHGFDADIPPDAVIAAGNGGDPNLPPGYVDAMNPSSLDYTTSPLNQILCSGAYGCHGSRDIVSPTKSMAGTHHADDAVLQFGTINTALQGLTMGTSYRMLSGVKGGESADWEESTSPLLHNEYYGQALADGGRTTTTQAYSDVDTMSEFCASCHGMFHMFSAVADEGMSPGASGVSPWIRHPTDVVVPNSAPYNSSLSYDPIVPVARREGVNDPASSQKFDGSNDPIVFCLSCHRAHASSEFDALRFSYNKMTVGAGGSIAGTGCFYCHGDKD